MLLVSVLFGLGAACGWGLSDFASKQVVDRMGTWGPLLALQLFASSLIIILWFLLGWTTTIAWPVLGYVLVGSLLGNLSWFLFYIALEHGQVSILAALYTLHAVIPLSWQLIVGDLRILPIHIVSIVVMLMAGILVSVDLGRIRQKAQGVFTTGLKPMLLATLLAGFTFIFLNQSVQATGWETTFFYQQVFSFFEVVILLALFGKLGKSRLPNTWFWFLIVCVGSSVALGSFNIGMERGEVGIVSVVASFSIAITAILAKFILKEQLVANQYIGIGLGIIGAIGLTF